MKISTRGRYAVQLMLDLALHSGEGPVPLKEVAQRQQIGGSYLESIVKQLARAGLVRSVRGAGGGYWLNGRPEDYTVGDILRQMEGKLAPVHCDNVENCGRVCLRADECVTMEVWEQIHDAISGVVDHITLADLMARYDAKQREKRTVSA
jgi:Rrf2 family protein